MAGFVFALAQTFDDCAILFAECRRVGIINPLAQLGTEQRSSVDSRETKECRGPQDARDSDHLGMRSQGSKDSDRPGKKDRREQDHCAGSGFQLPSGMSERCPDHHRHCHRPDGPAAEGVDSGSLGHGIRGEGDRTVKDPLVAILASYGFVPLGFLLLALSVFSPTRNRIDWQGAATESSAPETRFPGRTVHEASDAADEAIVRMRIGVSELPFYPHEKSRTNHLPGPSGLRRPASRSRGHCCFRDRFSSKPRPG
ncbi:hypothetical protein NKH36_02610 [Mesorhizobium sp. M1312]